MNENKSSEYFFENLFFFRLMYVYLQVVSPLLDQFCTAIRPVATAIGRKCVTHDLIDQADFDDLRAQETHGHGNRVICDKLFNKLQERGQTGFDEFKKILSWPSMSSPRVLLRNIQDVERKVVESRCPPLRLVTILFFGKCNFNTFCDCVCACNLMHSNGMSISKTVKVACKAKEEGIEEANRKLWKSCKLHCQ